MPLVQKLPPPSVPLTAQVRNNAINQIRGAVGLKALMPLQTPQPILILTPYAPMFGQNFYNIYGGTNQTEPNHSGTSLYLDQSMQFVFNTISGQSYMIDLFVDSYKPIYFSGVYTGPLTPLNGHINIGFKATSSTSGLVMKHDETDRYQLHFYRFELTKVN